MKISRLLLLSGAATGLLLLGKSLFNIKPLNPHVTDDDSAELEEYQIRELAQQIWESEGKPEGQAPRHWAMATELLRANGRGIGDSMKNHAGSQTPGNPSTTYSYIDKQDVH